MTGAIIRMVEQRAAKRRDAIVTGLAAAGVDAVVDGRDVRASGRGLAARWWRERMLRDAGRSGA